MKYHEAMCKAVTAFLSYVQLILNWVAVLAILSGVFSMTPYGRDSTDEQGWFASRSGFTLRTDQLTGCQYLEGSSLLLRVDGSGKHLGCK